MSVATALCLVAIAQYSISNFPITKTFILRRAASSIEKVDRNSAISWLVQSGLLSSWLVLWL